MGKQMDFKDQVRSLGERVAKMRDASNIRIETEEATKNAFVMPFIQTLGYNVFDPLEVVPEFTADVGIKKGEKIDYAIHKDGAAVILVECKHWNKDLDNHDSQLLRYFHASKAKFSILTNGINYRFYTDLVEPNKMDSKPFLEFHIDQIRDSQIEKLSEFHKSNFELDKAISSASELKYLNEIHSIIKKYFENPPDELVKVIAKGAYEGNMVPKVVEQFRGFVRKSIEMYVGDKINSRQPLIMAKHHEPAAAADSTPNAIVDSKEVVVTTTQEELEAFYIVKSILREKVSADRISWRDSASVFSIVLDNNKNKGICRFLFTANRKVLVTLDDARKEVKTELRSLDDIYASASAIVRTVEILTGAIVVQASAPASTEELSQQSGTE